MNLKLGGYELEAWQSGGGLGSCLLYLFVQCYFRHCIGYAFKWNIPYKRKY